MINDLIEKIQYAAAHQRPLVIRSSGSKKFYGNASQGDPFDISKYSGIIDYAPSELVITARAGTPLTEIEQALNAQNQMLAFEPPHFGDNSTLGGCIASGLSGPRRPYSGAVRDFVLGVNVLDGRGQQLNFGGQVMKNVAGYDVSRLMTGSLGTLGVLLDVSLKVLPLPAATLSLRFELDEKSAIEKMNKLAGQSLPITACCCHSGLLTLRLEGTSRAVQATHNKIGGEVVSDGIEFWERLREHQAVFFQSSLPLWRLSVPSTVKPIKLAGTSLIEWGGALRWLYSDAPAGEIRSQVAAIGGQATLFRGGDKNVGVFHPLPPALLALQKRIKHTFDPHGIFNPKRMFTEF
ncbi:MAG: glycolate oxidase subunit GlcE [Gallionella sp.]|nr:glycolate oxidase subunit GlcE [Gallionella sp.]